THSPRSIENVTPSSAGTRLLRRRNPERSASRRRNSLRRFSTSTAITLLSYESAGHEDSAPQPRRCAKEPVSTGQQHGHHLSRLASAASTKVPLANVRLADYGFGQVGVAEGARGGNEASG